MKQNVIPGNMELTANLSVVTVEAEFHVIKWMDHVCMVVLKDTTDRSVLIIVEKRFMALTVRKNVAQTVVTRNAIT